jgi:glycosyltransferase involved in cell wall biosynthesis
MIRELARHDAIVSSCLPPYVLALAPVHRAVTIADLYDPHEQELATLDDGRGRDRELRARFAIQALHLRSADVVLCASRHQRLELIRAASSVLADESRLPDPTIIPFGIPDPPPDSSSRPLRRRLPQIADGDTLILWWGSVWRWLDAETVVRALAQIASVRGDVKLVITAGRPPDGKAERLFDSTDEVRRLASELGVLDRTVFFFDEWIPYEARHEYLADADLGVTLHHHAEEARLAARARYMDYLWAGLPCVLARGDETAEVFGDAGFATVLDEPDAGALAAAILRLVSDPAQLERARQAGRALAAEHQWSTIGAKLRSVLADALASPRRANFTSPALIGGTGAYYARQLADRLAGSA